MLLCILVVVVDVGVDVVVDVGVDAQQPGTQVKVYNLLKVKRIAPFFICIQLTFGCH